MKWFKHESTAHNDEKIRELIHETGVEGYGILMICMELIAEKVDSNLIAEIEISWRVLSAKCLKREVKLKSILGTSAFRKLVGSEFRKDKVKLSCPNLLKRLDNWTSNSQVTHKQVSSNKNQNKKKNQKEKEINTPDGSLKPFQEKKLKTLLATSGNHDIDSEANQVAVKELVAAVAKSSDVRDIGSVAIFRAEKAAQK